jgi:hypothetical protein
MQLAHIVHRQFAANWRRDMPMRGELPVPVRSYARASAAQVVWSCLVATISNEDLQSVALFCAIGFLITINVVLRFPDFGEGFATVAVFP